MKQLVFISCVPDDILFVTQTKVQLHNFRKHGYSKLSRILVFIPSDRLERGHNIGWDALIDEFPEVTFSFYPDTEDILNNFIRKADYIPLLRPYMLKKHFEEYLYLSECAIFYHDSDVIFTKYLDFSPFLDDEINYLSDTKSYISAEYFDSKVKHVREDRLGEYKKVDVLQHVLDIFKLQRFDAVKNNDNSGGAQYLLKGMTAEFWQKVFDNCIQIRSLLYSVNEYFFAGSNHIERENRGFQRWCADMWAILFGLWAEKKETRCPKELDFAWATDLIGKLDNVYLYHDAGAGPDAFEATIGGIKGMHKLFYKRAAPYVNNQKTYFDDDLSYVSQDYCSYEYAKAIYEAVGKVLTPPINNN